MDPRRALNIDRTWQAAQFEDNVNRRRLEEIRSQSGHLDFGKGVQRVQFEELKLVGEIGHGTCGHVSRMQYGDRVMAVKQMARTQDQEELKRIIMDLDVVLKAHNCEHIVRCYGFFITESTVYVCMELMATCLDRLLKKTNHEPVPEPVIGKMAVSIVNALNYLKEQLEIIHRDVKPSNILLDWRGNIKLCDFGIAGKLVESRAHTRNAGCPPYMAPERFQQERSGDYDVRSDVWSVGITLVELARGHYPYSYCKSEFEVLTQIIENPPPTLKRNENFSLPFVDFVEKCLQKDPELRPKYRELMRHEFFVNSMSSNTDVAQWFREKMQVII